MADTGKSGNSGWVWAGAGCGCLLLVLAAGVVLGAAAWFWYAPGGAATVRQWVPGVPSEPSLPGPAGNGIPAAYAGTWLVVDGDPTEPATLYLRVAGNRITGTDHRGEATIDLRVAGGENLAGTITAEGQTVPCTAQISADRTSLILTLAPPSSEYYTVVLRRQ
jgi:hypothetical protein